MTTSGCRTRAALVVILLAIPACRSKARSPAAGAHPVSSPAGEAAAGPRVLVPRTTGRLNLDGHLEEPDWRRCGRGGPFVDATTGQSARPYSEVRFLWDDRHLYVGLYAADQDIRASGSISAPGDDVFSLRVAASDGGAFVIVLTPRAAAVEWRESAGGRRDLSWRSGITLGVDLDGTLNNPKDEDEEWVVEAAMPLRSLGLAARPGSRLRLGIERCDVPKDGGRRCGVWGRDARSKTSGVLELVD